MAPLGRRDFMKAAAALAAGGAACRASFPGSDLVPEQREVVLPGLDPAHDGLRVAQISDVHLGPLTPVGLVRAVIAAANAFEPDLVALTGDYLTRYHVVRRNTPPRFISEQLGGLRAPAVATLGNHDHYVDAAGAVGALEGLGYAALRNQNTTIRLRGAPFTIVGIDDQSTHHADVVQAQKGAAPGSRLYLAHVPLTATRLEYLGRPLLVLSGHTHGGQINVPPISNLFPYRAGMYHLGEVRLYVNRGVGNSWMPLRINAPPEVTLLTLRWRGAASVSRR